MKTKKRSRRKDKDVTVPSSAKKARGGSSSAKKGNAKGKVANGKGKKSEGKSKGKKASKASAGNDAEDLVIEVFDMLEDSADDEDEVDDPTFDSEFETDKESDSSASTQSKSDCDELRDNGSGQERGSLGVRTISEKSSCDDNSFVSDSDMEAVEKDDDELHAKGQ